MSCTQENHQFILYTHAHELFQKPAFRTFACQCGLFIITIEDRLRDPAMRTETSRITLSLKNWIQHSIDRILS